MNPRTSLTYDPAVRGYDTDIWKTLTGTVSAAVFLFPDSDPSDIDADILTDAVAIAENVATAVT